MKASKNKDEKQKLQEALHIAEVDHNYTTYCPLEWEYVGIFPRSDVPVDEGRARKGDPDMWDRVEKAMEDGTLQQLKDELTVLEKAPAALHRGDGPEVGADSEADSDDGFFDKA